MGCHFLLQGIFPAQGLNPCLLHWQVGSLPLSHQGSSREGNENSLQYSCQGNPIDREAWRVTVRGVTRVKHYLVTKQQHVCVCVCIYRWLSGKELVCQCRRHKRHRFDPWVGKIPWRRKWQPIPVFLPGKFHGQKNLAGYSPWGCKELDMTE